MLEGGGLTSKATPVSGVSPLRGPDSSWRLPAETNSSQRAIDCRSRCCFGPLVAWMLAFEFEFAVAHLYDLHVCFVFDDFL